MPKLLNFINVYFILSVIFDVLASSLGGSIRGRGIFLSFDYFILTSILSQLTTKMQIYKLHNRL
jgi:hypothetical protein